MNWLTQGYLVCESEVENFIIKNSFLSELEIRDYLGSGGYKDV